MLAPPARIPRGTYRIQFNRDFTFDDACKIIPYLAQLGISELYASPLFQASASSTHGYDVNDYNRISETLGGRKGLDRLSMALREHDLGLIVDFVPNHMGIDGEYNAWWSHVLENGAHSRYAHYFDIEWHPRLERLNDRVLVPMLGDHYGAVLERGDLSLRYDQGHLFIRYGSLKLPLRPRTYRLVLNEIDASLPSGDGRKIRLRDLAEAFENLPPHDLDSREVELRQLYKNLAALLETDPLLARERNNALAKFNGVPGDPASFISLHELLEDQHYRLAYWKVGAHEVNYRRFFAIDTLVGLRMEDPEVFAEAHQLLGELIALGVISGVRLDHIDGLWNPAEYLQNLAQLTEKLSSEGHLVFTLVEKILAPGETLPEVWPTHGTTGYEFAASLIELFLNREDEPAWTAIYEKFTGERETSRNLTYEDKLFALREIFPNTVVNLAIELDNLIEPDWHWRDLSVKDLETALRHFLACLPVYRTYRMQGEKMSVTEKRWINQAVEEGIRRNPCVDPAPLRFVGSVITGDYPPAESAPEHRDEFARWVCKLQQATGAVMAKSVEDTHFYRYVRMLGANEVGSHPSRFGQSIDEFHRVNRERQQQTPFCLLTTSTHDTKMSEDARARLFALAELPQEWESRLQTWHQLNETARSEIEGRSAPDAWEEYLFYQALLAAWPLGAKSADESFRERMKAYFRKAQGEAKRNTAWTYPHEAWHAAGDRFIDTLLGSKNFLQNFIPFAERIAQRGMIFSLAQTVLRLTSPGIPDLYQGNETWDFSLVDPDNRRPVDFARRADLLAGLDTRSPENLLQNWMDGAIKMHVVQTLLRCRSQVPSLFVHGEYTSLTPVGKRAEDVVAFIRRDQTTDLLVLVPRRFGIGEIIKPGESWDDTHLPLSESRDWQNLLTGDSLLGENKSIPMHTIFARLPVAVLISHSQQKFPAKK